MFGWLIFRADSIQTAMVIFRNIFAKKINLMLLLKNTNYVDFIVSLTLLIAVIISEIIIETHQETYSFIKLPYSVRWIIYLFMVLCISIFGIFQKGGNPFIYGQF